MRYSSALTPTGGSRNNLEVQKRTPKHKVTFAASLRDSERMGKAPNISQGKKLVQLIGQTLLDKLGLGVAWQHLKEEWQFLRAHWLSLLILMGIAAAVMHLVDVHILGRRFQGTVVQLSNGHSSTGDELYFVALLEIKNTGPPSIADGFHASLKVEHRTWKDIPFCYWPASKTIISRDGRRLNISDSEMLYNKVKDPIPTGGKATGFLAFVVAGTGMTQAPSDCEFTIYFKDIEGKEYHVREVTKRDSVGPTFAPGVKNPWFPTQPSPTPSEAPQSSTSAFTQPGGHSSAWWRTPARLSLSSLDESRARRLPGGTFALGLPCFGPTFRFVISSERTVTLQLAFQSNRLVLFENQRGGEFSIAPFSVLNGSGSGMSGLNGASESLPIRLKM